MLKGAQGIAAYQIRDVALAIGQKNKAIFPVYRLEPKGGYLAISAGLCAIAKAYIA
ncbi:hypothetical protein JCM17843_07440 [Kordiimonadales bacterium JCM 17843]|nr:hypothetical protein JCM17843_07440 [Kordiimonadales bacterium JCM 17843]